MRNYVQLFFGRVDYHFQNPNPPDPDIPFHEIMLNVDIPQLNVTMDEFIADLTAPLVFDSRTILGPRYILLDKTNVAQIVDAGTAARYWNNPTFCQFQKPGTPRNQTWADADGKEHKPQGTESKSGNPAARQTGNVMLSLVQILGVLYARLWDMGFRAGDPRFPIMDQLLKVIQDVLNQVATQKEIDDLFKELNRLGVT